MRHCHFLKSTCDIGGPPSRAPYMYVLLGAATLVVVKVVVVWESEQQPRGGGVLGLEKGTDCGLTAAERWLSRPKMAKKRGQSSYHIV